MYNYNAKKETNEKLNESFSIIMNNAQTIGRKKFAAIPLSLLRIGEYQRTDFYKKEKVLSLAANFDRNMMDPLTVAPHPEEGTFYVVNGMHRKEAVEIIGKEDSIECEILQGLSDDPAVRLVQEANIFRKQTDWTETLNPAAMHKANIICGDLPSIDLDNVVRKYGIEYKTNNRRGKVKANVLTGFSNAIRTVRTHGREMIDSIFYVLNRSMWQMEPQGLSSWSIAMLRNLFVYDPVLKANKPEMIDILKSYSPKTFEIEARGKYPKRSIAIACGLYFEDLLADRLGIDKNLHEKYAA